MPGPQPTAQLQPIVSQAHLSRSRVFQRRLAALLLAIAALANSSYLLAALLPATLPPGSTFISELSARGQPYSGVFRTAELVTGLALIAGVAAGWLRAPRNRWLGIAGASLALLGLLTAIDCLLPLDCPPSIDPACRAAEISGAVSWQHQIHTTTGVLETLAALVACAALTAGTRHSQTWWTTSRVAGWICLLQVGSALFIAWLWLAEVNAFGLDQRLATLGMSVLIAALAVGLARRDWDPSLPPRWPEPEPQNHLITVTVPAAHTAARPADTLAVALHGPFSSDAGTDAPAGAQQAPPVARLPGLGTARSTSDIPSSQDQAGRDHTPGAPVLFINGLSLPAQLWEPVLAAAPPLRAICFDRPGIGASHGTPGPDLDTQVEQLRAVLSAVRDSFGDLGRVVLVAHSHGALAATALARTDPELVAALVLIDPTLPKPLHPVSEAVQRAAVSCMAAVTRSRAGARVAGRATTWLQLRAGTAVPQCFWPPRTVRAPMAEQVRLQAAVAELAVEPEDLRLAARIAGTGPGPLIPVTVVAGARAGWPGYYHARTWVKRLEAYTRGLGLAGHPVTLEVLAGAHLLMLDDPGEVARIVTEMSQRSA